MKPQKPTKPVQKRKFMSINEVIQLTLIIFGFAFMFIYLLSIKPNF